jgi:hypothetical protein
MNEYRKALAQAAQQRGDAAVTNANRPRPAKAAAAGAKPMTPAQRISAIQREMKAGRTEDEAIAFVDRAATMPGNVNPGATSGEAVFLGFE